MRAFARVAALGAALACLMVAPSIKAQETSASAAAAAPAGESLPSRPIPYTQLARPGRPRAPVVKRRPLAARPAVVRSTATPALVVPLRPGARLAPAEPIPPAELEAFVDGVVRQGMAMGGVPGVTVSIVQNGQAVLEKGYGAAAPGRGVDPRTTMFRLGSVSKVFTWIAVLKAVEDGKLKLDNPVNAHLPPALRLRDQGYREPVRVRDLLAHTSGLEAREAGRLFVTDPRRLKSIQETLRSMRPNRIRAPGEPSSYANVDAALAGAMLESVRGQPFADLIDGALLGPLQLAHTSFREPYPARAGLPAPLPAGLTPAVGFQNSRRGLEPLAQAYAAGFAPAVSASSTATDMGRLMRTLLGFGWLEGRQVWGAQTAAALRSPLSARGSGVNGWPGGLMQSTLPGGFTAYGHTGAAPGFRASLTTAPDLRLGVFVAANSEAAGPMVEGLASEISQRFYAAPAAPMPAPDPELMRSRGVYEGDYLSTSRSHHGLEKFVDHLRRIARVRLVDGRLWVGQRGGGSAFAVDGAKDAHRFQALGGTQSVTFNVRNGAADSFTPSSNTETFQRIGVIFSPRTLQAAAIVVLGLSLAVLAAGAARLGRDARRSGAQTLAGGLQGLAALGWLASTAAFLLWRREMSDAVSLMLRWPGGWLVIASTLALLAAVASLVSLALLPQVWRNDRRGAGWSAGRKLGHTLVALAFVAYAALLAVWGALTPWST